jgi:DNA polymerase-1
MSLKPLLLLDGDLILYRNAIACEREVKFDAENWVLFCNEERAWDNIQAAIEHYKVVLKSDNVVLVFSEGKSFRYQIHPEYKANRQETRKPLGYSSLVARAREAYESKSFAGLEADDVMGIMSTTKGKAKRIIVSDDKDMKTIPGLLYRQGELMEITESQADYWHMYQTLLGDTADNFKGLPGVGEKTAEKLLAKDHSWETVVKAFEAKKLTAEDALIQARLARILRASDWNATTKEPIIWTP